MANNDLMQQASKYFEEAKFTIQENITEVSYKTWIESLVVVSCTDDTIVFQTPSDLNKGVLEKGYKALIKNSIEFLAKKEYKIEFVIPGEYSTNLDEEKSVNPNKPLITSNLNDKYVFDEFVIGSNNRFAHAASLAVAEAPSKAYNPLFIYGDVGLGKTHLMHAIGHYILNQNENTKVHYVTGEKFTNDLINAIKEQTNEEFRNKYRNVDVLLVDDIQFIAGKDSTQEEFFHTFNSLHQADKQVILTSDRQPKEIPTLEARLRSRFEWGLITDIQTPDYETRIAILKKKSERDGIFIDNNVFEFIAENIKSNIRELEGALNRVVAFSQLTNKEINLKLTEEALKDFISKKDARKIDVNLIKDEVAKYYNINLEDFESKRRNRSISYPRQICMYICRELTDLSLPKIGEEFGGRDHSTVIHAYDKIANDIENDPNIKKIVAKLIKEVKGE